MPSSLFAWLTLALPVAVSLHVIEEYVLGDFLGWFRRTLPNLADAITPPWAWGINVAFLGAALAATVPGAPVLLPLTVAVVLAINGALHLIFSVRFEWSPGVVTGVVLYLPLAAALFVTRVRDGGLSGSMVVAAIGLGAVVHAVPLATLRWRTRRAQRLGD